MFPIGRKPFVAFALSLLFVPCAFSARAAIVDPKLQAQISSAQPTATLTAIVTYKAPPTAADRAALSAIGVKGGLALKNFPMIGVWATAGQLKQIAALGSVRSLYANEKLTYHNDAGTAMIGAVKQRTMAGFGYTGRGVGVAVVDSGIDANHPDLPLNSRVKVNAKMLINGKDLDYVYVSGENPVGILGPVWLEGVPDTDITSGHGTHCAGIIGGMGTQSAGKYTGVAPAANLVGVSTGENIVVLWALAAWDYVMLKKLNTPSLNLRVVSNSWGTTGAFDPESPINLASKVLHDLGLTVVFSSGNSGPGSNTLNPYSVAPWVIGVAAGDKQTKLASFSSRGIKNDPLYHPNITAPGVSIVSCRAAGTAIGAVSGDITSDPNLPPDLIPWYAHLSGTSMACPMVSGTIALMVEANPNLTPSQIKTIVQNTATRMTGLEQHQVGAGYLNALAAIDAAKAATKPYGVVLNRTFNAKLNGSQTEETWDQNWDPTLPPPTHSYAVDANALQSDVFIRWDSDLNTFNLGVTDPNGTLVTTGSNLLWLLDGLSASLSFSYPSAGNWMTTVWGLRGQSSGTTGVGVPDVIHARVVNYYGTFSGLTDIESSPYASHIRRAVAVRLMDSFADGTFRPTSAMTRVVAAQMVASNCYVRQNLTTPNPFTDVTATYATYVQAVTAAGGAMRDVHMAHPAIMSGTTATTFSPSASFTRAELAVWLVRALGKEAEAQANMSTATAYTDDAQIPASARGYVVVASNLGLITPILNKGTEPPTYRWTPAAKVTRGEMAMIACKWHDLFFQ